MALVNKLKQSYSVRFMFLVCLNFTHLSVDCTTQVVTKIIKIL